jgi:hypothetical protein
LKRFDGFRAVWVVSRIFRTLDQATAPVCMTCDWWRGRMFM